MYPATQDMMSAEITYRRHRLADEYRRGARTNTRRWNLRPGTDPTKVRRSDGCEPH